MAKSQISKAGRRLLGMTFNGKPIFEPRPSHSLMLAAAGGGKTTAGAVIWIESMLADKSRAIVVTDSKDGEIAAQCADMCVRHGRKVAIIDDFNVLDADNLHKIQINPFGSVIASHKEALGDLIFSAESACLALIAEPSDGDSKNLYFRVEPRTMIEYVLSSYLARNPKLALPGGVWSLLADPDTLHKMALIDKDEGDAALSALATHVVEMRKNEEHYPQHRGAAVRSLRIFGAGSPLHHAGMDADLTHLQLLQENYVVFIVGPQRHMERLGTYYALHLQSFMGAVLSGEAGDTDFILDEFTNAPLKELISRLTTIRGYGGRCHMIAQSRSEIERRFGRLETLTIEENAVVKQWFGFSSFEEAERVSKAMGEAHNVTHSMGVNSDKADISGNFNLGKERLFPPERLMSLPSDEQIIHVKDIGFIHCKKVRQNEIAPYCHELADNPLEGGRLPPDPKITLPTKISGGKK